MTEQNTYEPRHAERLVTSYRAVVREPWQRFEWSPSYVGHHRTKAPTMAVCECYHDCAPGRDHCSLSGDWHVHPGEPCPLHPDAPGDYDEPSELARLLVAPRFGKTLTEARIEGAR